MLCALGIPLRSIRLTAAVTWLASGFWCKSEIQWTLAISRNDLHDVYALRKLEDGEELLIRFLGEHIADAMLPVRSADFDSPSFSNWYCTGYSGMDAMGWLRVHRVRTRRVCQHDQRVTGAGTVTQRSPTRIDCLEGHTKAAWCCVSQSRKTGKLHSTFREQFFPAVVGDLFFKGRCSTRVGAEELVGELLGTTPEWSTRVLAPLTCERQAPGDGWLEFTCVGVRVGAFGAHPPISTQTRDTRLLCDRSFPEAHRGSARARDPCCATHRKGSWLSGPMSTARHALREGVSQSGLAT